MAINRTDSTKQRIIKVATKVFAKKGLAEAKISEIAEGANVSNATIYEHFSNKEGLLFAIPAQITKSLFETMEFHLKLIRGSANKLRSIIYLFIDSYRRNPDFTAVLMIYLKHNKKFLDTKGHHAIKAGIRHISEIIEDGVASGEFKKGINPYLIRSMILGTIEHLVTNWVMTGNPDNLEEFVDPLIDTIILGIENKETPLDHWRLPRLVQENEAVGPNDREKCVDAADDLLDHHISQGGDE